MNGWRLENCFLSLCVQHAMLGPENAWISLSQPRVWSFRKSGILQTFWKRSLQMATIDEETAPVFLWIGGISWAINWPQSWPQSWAFSWNRECLKQVPKKPRSEFRIRAEIRVTQGLSIAPSAYIRMHLRKSASHNNLLGMIIPPPQKNVPNHQPATSSKMSKLSFWIFLGEKMLGRSNSAGGFTNVTHAKTRQLCQDHILLTKAHCGCIGWLTILSPWNCSWALVVCSILIIPIVSPPILESS